MCFTELALVPIQHLMTITTTTYTQTLTATLRELLREDAIWSWTPNQDEAFRKLKEMIVTDPVLEFHSQTAPSIVAEDASSYRVGVVMYQVQEDGPGATIAYVSRTLTEAQRRYS